MKKVLLIISDGFRDEELLQPKEIFQNAGLEAKLAAVSLDEAKGMLGAKAKPDILLGDARADDYCAIVFVGGSGSSLYWDNYLAHKLAQDALDLNRVIAAICIAPVTLARAGVLKGKRATVSAYEAGELKAAGANYTGRPVERDGNIITASGPTAAKEFAEEIVRAIP